LIPVDASGGRADEMKSPPAPVPDFTTVSVANSGTRANVAATVALWFNVTVQVVPVQAPENPLNCVLYPPVGALASGVNVTTVPAGNRALQFVGQLMPAGVDWTTAFAAPEMETVSR
jgi:hypothetical protein